MVGQEPVVLCKDCKHSFRSFPDILLGYKNPYAYKCRKNFTPDSVDVSLVVGARSSEGKFENCSYTRLNSQPCKEAGLLWEPRDAKKHFFTIIKHEAAIGQK
jgi:hypothetical protein